MNSKFSTLKSIVVAAALVAGVSGLARADDSSMNMWTGDSYRYFNGGQNFPDGKPVLNYGPSTYRATPPQDPMAFQQEHFPFVNPVDNTAVSTASPVFHPHDELPSVYGEASIAKSPAN
jgi:hypothetical protein